MIRAVTCKRRRVTPLAAALVLACLVIGHATLADEDAPPPVETIVLLDGAGDMAAGAKAEKYRAELGTVAASALRDRSESTRFIAFAGCDGAAAAPPRPDLKSALQDIGDGGRRNLSAALAGAEAAFPGAAAANRRIVAIVGGPGQCLSALCATAAGLKARAPGTVIDVVAVGMEDQDAERYECVARNTGGNLVRAREGALAATLREILAADSRQVARVEGGEEPAIALPPTRRPIEIAYRMSGPEISLPRGLRLTVALSGEHRTLETGARFELWRSVAEGAPELVAGTDRTATPLFAVPPGPYLARIHMDGFVHETSVTVPDVGVVSRKIVLDAGRLALSAKVGGRTVAHGAGFRLERLDAEQPAIELDGRGRVLATAPAGRYRVTAVVGAGRTSEVIELAAGATDEMTLSIPMGFLRVGADAASGAVSVLQNGVEVARADLGGALFRLPPGEYDIYAANDGAPLVGGARVENGAVVAARLAPEMPQKAAAPAAADAGFVIARTPELEGAPVNP